LTLRQPEKSQLPARGEDAKSTKGKRGFRLSGKSKAWSGVARKPGGKGTSSQGKEGERPRRKKTRQCLGSKSRIQLEKRRSPPAKKENHTFPRDGKGEAQCPLKERTSPPREKDERMIPVKKNRKRGNPSCTLWKGEARP